MKPTLMQICIFYCRYRPILKALGQFENLVLEIMTTRRNIRLIARSSFHVLAQFRYFKKLLTFSCVQIYQYHSKEGKPSHQHTTAIVFLSPNVSNRRNGNGICDYLHAG